jgi:pimeloyl-ACP methyl ester carboxylesterase
MNLTPFKIQTSKLTLAGFRNDVTEGEPIIAIHGWLDNAASFLPLADVLELDRPFFAVEMPGHGWSDHRPSSASYHLVDNVVDMAVFIDAVFEFLKPGADSSDLKVTLLGHSLGGIVCSFLAASKPEKVNKLILLDSLGPLTDEIENVLPQLRKAVAKASQVRQSKKTVYPNKDMAARVRMMGVGKVSQEAAMLLVERGIEETDDGFVWRSDPKLLAPSMVRFTEKQVKVIIEGIECPTFLLCGKQGYFANVDQVQERISYFKDVTRIEVEGGHHFHMDGDVDSTGELINEILES